MATRKKAAPKKTVAKKATKKAAPKKAAKPRKEKVAQTEAVEEVVQTTFGETNAAIEEAGHHTLSVEDIMDIVHKAEQEQLIENAEYLTLDGLSTAARLVVAVWLNNKGAKYINNDRELSTVDTESFITALLDQRIGAVRNLGNGIVDLVSNDFPGLRQSNNTASLESISCEVEVEVQYVGEHVPAQLEIGGAIYNRVG